MARLLLIFILQGFFVSLARAQSFQLDDLVALSSLSPKKFDNYMNEKGYSSGVKTMQDDAMAFTFFEKKKKSPVDSIVEYRRVSLFKQENDYCFAFYTTSLKEYHAGLNYLRANFFYGRNQDSSQSPLYQRKNMTVETSQSVEDSMITYSFLLKRKELPANVNFAEDLLNFDSHELLATFFGEQNVKKDVYYFSEKKLKRCSVLFGNSNRQVVFVWDDEDNLRKLSYILISGVLPTENGMPFNDNISRNKWTFKSGIYSGMSIRDLLDLNGKDFTFYGEDSEFSMMIEPENSGNIDFKKTGIMLTSLDGSPGILRKTKVSATAAIENHIALHVFYIMLTP